MIGVYLLKNNKGKIIYIGKSTDIKNRVKIHLKSSGFAEKIYKADYIETQNEAGALIKESELIKKYKPRYNILLRDGKQYFYVAFSRDKLPILRITHQPKTLAFSVERLAVRVNKKLNPKRYTLNARYAGPFTDGKSLKTVLKYLRRAFPYYTQKHGRLPCSYCHLALCPGPSPNVTEYKNNILKINLILNGKRPRVINALKKEMARFSKNLDFEKAAKTRNQIEALENVFSHSNLAFSVERLAVRVNKKLNPKRYTLNAIDSLEAYDISNIQGKEPVASMARFDNGKPNKSLYRKFKINLPEKPNDTAMIKEVIRRRLAHPEWPYPDLFLIDGGRGQLNAVIAEMRKFKTPLSLLRRGAGGEVVALAKRFNELYIPDRKRPIPLDSLSQRTRNLLMYARDEAHRFAIAYHRKLHRKKFML